MTMPLDEINPKNIAGVFSVENTTYDLGQLFSSLIAQGLVKRLGNSLRIGQQILQPLPPDRIPASTGISQAIIQNQIRSLFEEIGKVKAKLDTRESTNSRLADESRSEMPSITLDQSRQEVQDPLWENLIQKAAPKQSGSRIDVGENNLNRKWLNSVGSGPLKDEINAPTQKIQTEYFNLGVKGKKQEKGRKDPGGEGHANIDPSIIVLGNSSSTEILNKDFRQDEFKGSSLDQLAESLLAKLEKTPNRICPACLSNLPPSAMFCSKCGLKVQKRELILPNEPDQGK